MAIPEHLKLTVPDTEFPRIVIIGGGFAGLRLAKDLAGTKAQVVMLDRNNFHTFQPLLYQVATAGLEADSIAGPLRKSFKGHFNYVFRMVKVLGVDFDRKEVITRVGSLAYDYLVIANGSATNYFGKEKFREKVLPLKRVVHALDLRSHILQTFEQAELTADRNILRQMMDMVVVGGGPTGVEVAGALSELRNHILPIDYPDLDLSKMRIILVEGTGRLLNGMSEKSGNKALQYLQEMGVEVWLNTLVNDYSDNVLHLGDKTLNTYTVIWAAGVKGRILSGIDAEKVSRSRIIVNDFNQIAGLEDVFAIGDVALMKTKEYPDGLPMLAPVAIQQGQLLAKNFKRMLTGKPLEAFKYLDKGAMATIGRNKAVVDMPGGVHLSGFIAWLIWMFVHIMYLIGFRNKLITLNNWIWSYLTYDKGTRLIIRTFTWARRNAYEKDES